MLERKTWFASAKVVLSGRGGDAKMEAGRYIPHAFWSRSSTKYWLGLFNNNVTENESIHSFFESAHCWHKSVPLYQRVYSLHLYVYKKRRLGSSHSPPYHLNLSAGHEAHLSRHTFRYHAALTNKQRAQQTTTESTQPASNEWFVSGAMGTGRGRKRSTRREVCVWVFVRLCRARVWCVCVYRRRVWRILAASPHRPVPKSCVQAVPNKLLNLIKSSAIILPSPQGARTSAIMNTFSPIITLWLQSLPLEKPPPPPGNQAARQGDTCINGQVMRL